MYFFPSHPINVAACLGDGGTWEGTVIDLLITWRLAVPLVS